MRKHSEVVVLHTLRCMGAVTLARLAAAVELADEDAESVLIDLAIDGLTTRTTGPFGVWRLTESGRAEDARHIAAELALAGAEDTVDAVFERFLELNPHVLQLCTDWQLRQIGGARVLNDHRDHRYDDRLLRRLSRLTRDAEPLCGRLSEVLPRFAPYCERLKTAHDRAVGGDVSAVSDDLDSFHAVWFQLHEDLLATLRRQREH